MAERIVDSVGDRDLLAGRFGDRSGFVPVEFLMAHAGLIAVSTTTYKLRKSDRNKLVQTTSGDAVTITVPPASDVAFPDVSVISWTQTGAGQITFAAGDGVTIRTPETLLAAKQYASGCLIYLGSDVWLLSGNLEAA